MKDYPGGSNIADKTKLEISYVFYVYLHYFIFVWIVDAINLFCVFLKLDQTILLSHILACIILSMICLFDYKQFEFVKINFTVTDFLIIMFIILIGVYKCIYPDTSHDVMAYHYINQEPIWYDNESFYILGASFPFADRLFYLFRYILGYRLGTIFNVLVFIIIYFQIKRLLTFLLEKKEIDTGNKLVKLSINLGSCSIILLEGIMMEFGTYMTDLVAIPLMLEAIMHILRCASKPDQSENRMKYFVTLLTFIFLCKFISAILVTVLLLTYLWLNRKTVTLIRFLQCFVLAVILVLPLVLYNIYTLGVPLYELSFVFNNYATSGAVDVRWGGENLLQKLLWPLYMASYPSERHMELIVMPNYFPISGIVIFVYAILKRKKELVNKEFQYLIIITLTSFYLWSFSGGVDRYAFINLILFGIIMLYSAILFSLLYQKWKAVAIGAIISIQAIGSLYSIMVLNTNWQLAPSVIAQIKHNKKDYFGQINYFFNDKGELIEGGDQYTTFVYTEKPNTIWGFLLNKDAKVYQLNLLDRVTEKKASQVVNTLKDIFENETVYTAVTCKELNKYIDSLSEYNLKAIDFENIRNTYLGNLMVIQIDYEEGFKNQIYTIGTKPVNEAGKIKGNQLYRYHATVMVSPYITWTDASVDLNFYYEYGGEKMEVHSESLKPGEIYEIDFLLDLSDFDRSDEIPVYVNTSHEYSLERGVVEIINEEITLIESSIANG